MKRKKAFQDKHHCVELWHWSYFRNIFVELSPLRGLIRTWLNLTCRCQMASLGEVANGEG